MTKENLKAKWGKYCDTDKLVKDMMELLSNYNHRNSVNGVCVVLDKYFTKKEPLIKMFATSNHYIGDMRIAMKKEFERNINPYAVRDFCSRFPNAIGAPSILLAFKDADGHVLPDYLQTGCAKVNVKSYVQSDSRKAAVKKLDNFDLKSGATAESAKKMEKFVAYTDAFARQPFTKLSGNMSADGLELKAGTKTSRAFNKMCAHYGIDKATEYDRLFAQYADLVTSPVRHLYFVISLNPLDYLTMSIGPNWTSCHSIKSSDGYGGMACGGCMSYMLDNSSIITYVTQNVNVMPLHKEGKIYRQMFHYGDEVLIQSRLYPQGNDGATNLYKKFRDFMEEEFSELLELDDNQWCDVHGRGLANSYGRHTGHQYNDFCHNECGIFYPTAKSERISRGDYSRINIGTTSICPCCGKAQDTRNRLAHQSCSFQF